MPEGIQAMRIGVVPMLDRSWGGIYQYSVTFVHALHELELEDEIVLFVPSADSLPDDLRPSPFRVEVLPDFDRLGKARQLVSRFLPTALIGRLARLLHSLRGPSSDAGRAGLLADSGPWRDWFAGFELDMLVFTVDNELSFQSGVPYAVVIHDLQHRLQPDLPEYSAESDWERREYRMSNAIGNAAVVIVDSEVGREDVMNCYGETGVDEAAVLPLPFVPAHYLGGTEPDEARTLSTRAEYSLPPSYLFYPAQFWPHKNHVRIAEALGALAQEGVLTDLVLVGSNSGALRQKTFDEMMRAATRLGVDGRIHYLGYVPDESMAVLYSEAAALVMPTFFGPTNIPVLEAWHFDCPVVTSDLRGIREQVGDAAILVDPNSSESIARGIRTVLDDDALRKDLVRKGHERLAAYTRDDYLERLRTVLGEAKRRVARSAPGEGDSG